MENLDKYKLTELEGRMTGGFLSISDGKIAVIINGQPTAPANTANGYCKNGNGSGSGGCGDSSNSRSCSNHGGCSGSQNALKCDPFLTNSNYTPTSK